VYIISEGYLRFAISLRSVHLPIGDVYSRNAEQRLIWKGRKEDYIYRQVNSFLVKS
jgi:hypothetical protein